jgi:putative transposase
MADYIRTRHSVYMLTYHMIFVTKWRKPVISDEVGDFMVETARRLCTGYGGELVSGETDKDHIHLLVSLPPGVCVGTIVRNLKTQLSREVHTHPEYGPYVQKFFYGDAPLWSDSYFIATTGSVSMETVKSYIESQRTDEHKRKYDKRSVYWKK